MKLLSVFGLVVATSLVFFADKSLAQPYVFTHTSPTYNTQKHTGANCANPNVGTCYFLDTTKRSTLTVTMSAAPPHNVKNFNVSNLITSYTLDSGYGVVITGPSDTTSLEFSQMSVDEVGNVVDFNISAEHHPEDSNDTGAILPGARYNMLRIEKSTVQFWVNPYCASRGAGESYSGPHNCNVGQLDTESNLIMVDDTVAPAAVPTLSEWAMILLATMLVGVAALVIQRRRTSTI